MIDSCPHCRGKIEFTTGQIKRLQAALAQLPSGKKLTLSCMHCSNKLALDKDGNMDTSEIKEKEEPAVPTVKPPEPPDMGWISDDSFSEEEKLEDIPMALILHPSTRLRTDLIQILEQMGYKVFASSKIKGALEKMQFINFACIVLHSNFGDTAVGENMVHMKIQQMAMMRRRFIFYILMGPEFHTLYDLQALSYSANLTINEKDLPQLGVIMRKAIPAYEELFAPIMEEVGSYGR